MTVFKKLDKIESKKKKTKDLQLPALQYQNYSEPLPKKKNLLRARDNSQPGNHSIDHNSLNPSLHTSHLHTEDDKETVYSGSPPCFSF